MHNQKLSGYCICWKGTDFRSTDDSVTVLLICFGFDFFFFLLVRTQCKTNASHQRALGKDIYTLLLFLACFVKCDVAITNNLTEFIYSLLTESPVAAT